MGPEYVRPHRPLRLRLSHLQDEKSLKIIEYTSDWICLAAALRTDWRGHKDRSRETIEERIVQSRDDGGLDRGGRGGDGEKCSDSGYILKEETIGFPEGLDVGMRERERLRMIPRIWVRKNGVNTFWHYKDYRRSRFGVEDREFSPRQVLFETD